MGALAGKFPGVTVEVGSVERWDRPCITVRWNGFADLLPEERFHRIVKELPGDVRDASLSGFIWLELAPEETIEEFLKYPRSEDIDGKEPILHADLTKLDFYSALGSAMGRSPKASCTGDFSRTLAALKKCNATATKQREARLLFIRHGAYCDCQVLEAVRPQLDKAYGK